jgi:hypothetical protein
MVFFGHRRFRTRCDTKETNMKMLLASLAALTSAAPLAPMAAQADPIYRHGYEQQSSVQPAAYRVDRDDFQRLRVRIDQGLRSGELSRREGYRLNREVRQLQDRQRQYMRTGGIQPWEARELHARYRQLSAAVFQEKHDRDHRRF